MGKVPVDPSGAAVVVNKALIHRSLCPRHPRYQAKRPPKSCESCAAIFDRKLVAAATRAHWAYGSGPGTLAGSEDV